MNRTISYRPRVLDRHLIALLLPLALTACEDRGADSVTGDAGFDEPDVQRSLEDAAAPDGAAPDAAPALDARVADGALDAERDAAAADAAADQGPPPDAVVLADSSIDPICQSPPEAPPQPPIDLRARCRDGGPMRIKDLRDARCPDFRELPEAAPGRNVTIAEAVVTGVYGSDFAVQDLDGGPYSGLWVYNRPHLPVADLRPGTRVRLSGSAIEFYGLTEVILANAQSLEVLGQGEPPAPFYIADPGRVADRGDLVDVLESMLIELPPVQVVNTEPDCPRDFRMFVVSGDLRIADEVQLDYEPSRGDLLQSVVGVLTYTFEHQKVLPRSMADIDLVYCGGLPDKCDANDCPAAPDAVESGRLVITEIQNNPVGDDRFREYLELYNPGPEAVDLAGWRVQDCAGHRAPLAGRLDAGDYFVVGRSLDRRENGGVRVDALMGDLFLPNGYGSLLVYDADGVLVDQVRYAPSGDGWPRRDPGEAAELLDTESDNRLGASWRAAGREYGEGGSGSPGAATRN